MVRRWIWALVVLGVIGAVLAGWHRFRGEAVQAQTDRRCFAETNLCIEGAIRQYWERNGGLMVFGYPITAQAEETVESWTGPVQWFERDRLEDHRKEGKGVMAGRLGARVLELQGRPWETFPAATGTGAECRLFAETGHSLCEPFKSYWERNGGLERFGYPITEPMNEIITSTFSGTVQYFERRRMEHHPENQQPYDILLGLLGREVRERSQSNAPRIAYTSLQLGNQDVYVCDLTFSTSSNNWTCSSNRRLMEIPGKNDGRPAWSPDGQQIAFESDLDGDWGVYSVSMSGSSPPSLTEADSSNTSTDGNPSWAAIPELGWRVAFHSDRSDRSDRNGNYNIFLVDSNNSSDVQPLTNNNDNYYPALSPDGKRIAFASDRTEGNDDLDIYVADLNTTNKTVSLSEPKNLTANQSLSGKCRYPAWSPDGKRILFENQPPAGQADIWVVNADGTYSWGDPQNLTNSPDFFDGHPDWSPDGLHIVFQSNRAGKGHFDIYIAEMKQDNSLGDPYLVIGDSIDVDVGAPDWWGPTPTPTAEATPTPTPTPTAEATPTPTN